MDAVLRRVSISYNLASLGEDGFADRKKVASVNESASIAEFLHVTKVHAGAVWDFLTV